MANITTCPTCGHCYEEISEEAANAHDRQCRTCWYAKRKLDRVHAQIMEIASAQMFELKAIDGQVYAVLNYKDSKDKIREMRRSIETIPF